MATTPLIARAYGRGDKEAASKLVAHALWIAISVGVAATIFLSLYTRSVVTFFGASETVAPYAVKYLRARISAAPSYLAIMVLQGAFRGHQDTRTPFFIGILANCVNLTLYPILTLALRMGVVGAGLATAAGQMTASFGLILLLFRKRILHFSDLKSAPPIRAILPLLRTGVVLSIRTLSILSTVSFATATAARMGTANIAAFEITRQLWALFARLFDAISVTAQSLLPVELGRGNFKTARTISNRLMKLSVLMGSIFLVVLWGGAQPLSKLFSNDPVVVGLVASCFPVMAAIEPLNGLVFVLDGCFTAGRQFSFLAAAIFGACAISWGSLVYIRAAGAPVAAVWGALNLMMVFRALFLGARYLSRKSPIPKMERSEPAKAA